MKFNLQLAFQAVCVSETSNPSCIPVKTLKLPGDGPCKAALRELREEAGLADIAVPLQISRLAPSFIE
jgi:hypothetical protein